MDRSGKREGSGIAPVKGICKYPVSGALPVGRSLPASGRRVGFNFQGQLGSEHAQEISADRSGKPFVGKCNISRPFHTKQGDTAGHLSLKLVTTGIPCRQARRIEKWICRRWNRHRRTLFAHPCGSIVADPVRRATFLLPSGRKLRSHLSPAQLRNGTLWSTVAQLAQFYGQRGPFCLIRSIRYLKYGRQIDRIQCCKETDCIFLLLDRQRDRQAQERAANRKLLIADCQRCPS